MSKKLFFFGMAVLVIALIAVISCDRNSPLDTTPELDIAKSSGATENPAVEDPQGREPPVTESWNPSGWQNAIILEAKHALSQRNNGTSSQILNYSGSYYGGDWDYVGSDPRAREIMSQHYGWNWGLIGSPGGWPEHNLTGNWRTVGHGGYCKFFADLVQWRATGGAKGFLPINNQAHGSVNNVEPGDIIQRTDPDHTALVIAILQRYSNGRVRKVDVIDSNYIGGDGEFIIARHPITLVNSQGNYLYHTYH